MFDVWLNQAPTLGRRVFIIDPQLLNLCPLTAGCYTPGLDALEDLISSCQSRSMMITVCFTPGLDDLAHPVRDAKLLAQFWPFFFVVICAARKSA